MSATPASARKASAGAVARAGGASRLRASGASRGRRPTRRSGRSARSARPRGPARTRCRRDPSSRRWSVADARAVVAVVVDAVAVGDTSWWRRRRSGRARGRRSAGRRRGRARAAGPSARGSRPGRAPPARSAAAMAAWRSASSARVARVEASSRCSVATRSRRPSSSLRASRSRACARMRGIRTSRPTSSRTTTMIAMINPADMIGLPSLGTITQEASPSDRRPKRDAVNAG